MMLKLFAQLFDAVFPLNCSFCGKYDYFSSKLSICKTCIQDSQPLSISNEIYDDSKCKVCESPLLANECTYCTTRNVFFSKLKFIRLKGELERKIIHKIKFGNSPHLRYFFRLGLKKHLSYLKTRNYAAIVKIPSNKKTIRKRPIPVCNPVTSLIEKQLNIKALNLIVKQSNELQSGKSFRERFIHAQSAFSVKTNYLNLLDGNYLLVDDVFTTGATINEIAKLLLMNGAKEVDVLVLLKGKS